MSGTLEAESSSVSSMDVDVFVVAVPAVEDASSLLSLCCLGLGILPERSDKIERSSTVSVVSDDNTRDGAGAGAGAGAGTSFDGCSWGVVEMLRSSLLFRLLLLRRLLWFMIRRLRSVRLGGSIHSVICLLLLLLRLLLLLLLLL